MKTYLIRSTEYKFNTPDRFIMDENGNYYGVMPHSYAIFHNFPKSIDFWMTSTCSDSDRFFYIESVDLTDEQLEEFDGITKDYLRMKEEIPVFGEQYPDGLSKEWKTKKAYHEAVEDYMLRYNAWREANRNKLESTINGTRSLLQERTRLFKSFSKNGSIA